MDFHRKSRSIGRRSSILKIDKDDDTACNIVFDNRGPKSLRRVSFAETYQVKEFPRDSPQQHVVWQPDKTGADSITEHEDPIPSTVQAANKMNHEIKGLDKLLTGTIQEDPYQSEADNLMPEMNNLSSLFSGDRIILGPLDMDATNTLGNIDVPGGAFEVEPSAEIKFDGSALLRNLKGKPSDRLKTMQIYSPNREAVQFSAIGDENMVPSFTVRSSDRSPLKSLSLQEADGDDFVMDTTPPPIKDFNLFGDPPVQQEPLLDAKSFLSKLSGKKTAFTGTGESTAINDCVDENMEITMGLNFYTQGPTTDSLMQFNSKEVTRYFDNTGLKMGLEETACVGGIIQQSEKLKLASSANSTINIEETTRILTDDAAGMDETECIGSVMSDGPKEFDFTRQAVSATNMDDMNGIDGDFAVMDETKSVTAFFDSTASISNQRSASVDTSTTGSSKYVLSLKETCIHSTHDDIIYPDVAVKNMKGISDNEMTRRETICMGGILEKSDTSGLNSTNIELGEVKFSSGRILEKLRLKKSITSNEIAGTDDTKCLVGILNDTANTTSVDDIGMDETKCTGGILEKSRLLEVTKTKIECHLNKTTSQTVSMDETKCVGGININETISQSSIRIGQEQINLSDNQARGMTETQCIGGIMNIDKAATTIQTDKSFSSSLEKTKCFDFDDTSATSDLNSVQQAQRWVMNNKDDTSDVTGSLENKSLLFSKMDDNALISGVENSGLDGATVSMMQETKCVGGILELEKTAQYLNEADDIGEATDKHIVDMMNETSGKSEINKTLNKTAALEETTCIGGIIRDDPTGNITRPNTTSMNKTLNKTAALEETTCLVGIIHDDPTGNITRPNTTSMNKTLNKTAALEETTCFGGIIHGDPTGNITRHNTTSMNETNCLGGIINRGPLNNLDMSGCELIEDSDELKQRVDHTKLFSMDMEETQCSGGMTVQHIDSDLNYQQVDNEVAFVNKKSCKRGHEIEENNKNEEKTKDFTMSQSKYQRLKDMLILSKGKTTAHLKTSDSKTSEGHSNISKYLGVSFNETVKTNDYLPASKKMKLSESPVKSEGQEKPCTGETAGESMAKCDGEEKDNISHLLQASCGIDDEQMPEEMCTGVLSNADVANLTHGSNTTDHNGTLFRTDMANITHSSGSSDNNQSMSMCHTRSLLQSSFVKPSGPMTMETFMKALYVAKTKMATPRCSLVAKPKIDMEDINEVMLAQLVLAPSVRMKKDMCDILSERIRKEQETVEWLQTTLEEIQPQIFQDCANLEGKEYERLQKKVLELSAVCFKKARKEWIDITTTPIQDTLNAVKNNGKIKAEEMLQDVQSKSKKVDDFLTSLDEDMLEMEKNESLLNELDSKEAALASDLERLELDIERKTAEENQLTTDLQQLKVAQATLYDVKEKIKVYLMCVDWDLDELSESHAVFTFLDKKLVLTVHFCTDGQDILIQDATVTSILNFQNNPRYMRFAHTLAVVGIESVLQRQKYKTIADLRKLLKEVSATVHEVKLVCDDLKPANFRSRFQFERNRFEVELWSIETFDEIRVSVVLDPCKPLFTRADIDVTVMMGNMRVEDIKARLDSVQPGERYLSRLLKVAIPDPT